MDKDIVAAFIADDEAKALLSIEELDHAGAFADHLGRHLRTAPATAKAATAATAEAIPISKTVAAKTAATAETVSAKSAAAERLTAESAETLIAELFAFVAAAPATFAAASSVKTHA